MPRPVAVFHTSMRQAARWQLSHGQASATTEDGYETKVQCRPESPSPRLCGPTMKKISRQRMDDILEARNFTRPFAAANTNSLPGQSAAITRSVVTSTFAGINTSLVFKR